MEEDYTAGARGLGDVMESSETDRTKLQTVHLPAAVQSLSMISAPARKSPKANS